MKKVNEGEKREAKNKIQVKGKVRSFKCNNTREGHKKGRKEKEE